MNSFLLAFFTILAYSPSVFAAYSESINASPGTGMCVDTTVNDNHYTKLNKIWTTWTPNVARQTGTGSVSGQYASVDYIINTINSAITNKGSRNQLAVPWVCYNTTDEGNRALNCAYKRARQAGLYPSVAYNGKYQVRGAHVVTATGLATTDKLYNRNDYCTGATCWGYTIPNLNIDGLSAAVAYAIVDLNQVGVYNYIADESNCDNLAPTTNTYDCQVVGGGLKCSTVGLTCTGNVA